MNNDTTQEIPYGYCGCGCGQKTTIPKKSSRKRGVTRNVPMRFLPGHNTYLLESQPIAERFWAKVDKRAPDECWEWQGNRSIQGYGRLCIHRKLLLAHRISYELHNGSISNDLEVCHGCDNPSCVNPHHLWLGTHAENMKDRDAKDRCHPGHSVYGEAHTNSKLKESDVIEIRKLLAQGLLQKDIALLFGVSTGPISCISRGKGWRHVP